jgi:hypothetical protein
MAQRLYLAAAVLALSGAVGFITWLVVHNVHYTQRDLALKAAQLASGVAVRDNQVMDLLMQYTYDATGQRLFLGRAWAACTPVPHIKATTMSNDRGVIFVPGVGRFARRLEKGSFSLIGHWHLLTTRNAGILVGERMRQIWALLANGSGLSPTERLLPYSEAWRVRLFEQPFPVKRRSTWRRLVS